MISAKDLYFSVNKRNTKNYNASFPILGMYVIINTKNWPSNSKSIETLKNDRFVHNHTCFSKCSSILENSHQQIVGSSHIL